MTTSNSIVSLLGYGKVQWSTSSKGQMEITMPSLPLDSELMWAWTFKIENIGSVNRRRDG